ncbi:hypothetical protein ACSSS7_000631 [Eimeria intestinalis]
MQLPSACTQLGRCLSLFSPLLNPKQKQQDQQQLQQQRKGNCFICSLPPAAFPWGSICLSDGNSSSSSSNSSNSNSSNSNSRSSNNTSSGSNRVWKQQQQQSARKQQQRIGEQQQAPEQHQQHHTQQQEVEAAAATATAAAAAAAAADDGELGAHGGGRNPFACTGDLAGLCMDAGDAAETKAKRDKNGVSACLPPPPPAAAAAAAAADADGAAGAAVAGFRVLRVFPGTPAETANLEFFFDFLVQIEEEPLCSPEVSVQSVLKRIDAAEGRPIQVYIQPTRSASSLLLLGVSLQFCPFEVALCSPLRVLGVLPNSPAEKAGLHAGDDYILGDDKGAFRGVSDLIMGAEEHLGSALSLYVFNKETEQVRTVVLQPCDTWGGDGCLGCDVGSGFLHRVPFSRAAKDVDAAAANAAAATAAAATAATAAPARAAEAPTLPQIPVYRAAQQKLEQQQLHQQQLQEQHLPLQQLVPANPDAASAPPAAAAADDDVDDDAGADMLASCLLLPTTNSPLRDPSFAGGPWGAPPPCRGPPAVTSAEGVAPPGFNCFTAAAASAAAAATAAAAAAAAAYLWYSGCTACAYGRERQAAGNNNAISFLFPSTANECLLVWRQWIVDATACSNRTLLLLLLLLLQVLQQFNFLFVGPLACALFAEKLSLLRNANLITVCWCWGHNGSSSNSSSSNSE